MGRLLDALRTESETAKPAKPANPANLRGDWQEDSQVRQIRGSSESENPTITDLRGRLLKVADAEGLPLALVRCLPDADVAACEGHPTVTVRTYLRALHRGADMDAGIIPAGYSQAAYCNGCGPVWLWPEAPAHVIACPWCFRRKAGRPFPRPPAVKGEQ